MFFLLLKDDKITVKPTTPTINPTTFATSVATTSYMCTTKPITGAVGKTYRSRLQVIKTSFAGFKSLFEKDQGWIHLPRISRERIAI